jgi:hypothetical protein
MCLFNVFYLHLHIFKDFFFSHTKNPKMHYLRSKIMQINFHLHGILYVNFIDVRYFSLYIIVSVLVNSTDSLLRVLHFKVFCSLVLKCSVHQRDANWIFNCKFHVCSYWIVLRLLFWTGKTFTGAIRDQLDGRVNTEGSDTILCLCAREAEGALFEHTLLKGISECVIYHLFPVVRHRTQNYCNLIKHSRVNVFHISDYIKI